MNIYKNNYYQCGYKDYMINMIKQRTVENEAKFLLPYLRDDTRLLDCGCGPGSVTVGFAKYITKGEIVGIDIEPSQVEMTKKLAADLGIKNISLQVADIHNLPFPDNSFDIVFAHMVIVHLPEYRKAIREVKRVLKPGGIIAVRDPVFKEPIIYPDTPEILEIWNFRIKMPSIDGADFNLGKKMRSILVSEGFNNVSATASINSYGDKKSFDKYKKFVVGELTDAEYVKKALASGMVTKEKLQHYIDVWTDFCNNPEAFVGVVMCEAIGYK
jgi:ubiquinone/menaquinone biosynthesis C-methylase UbiE